MTVLSYSLTRDGETYTVEQLATAWKSRSWIEDNILYPCDPKTKKPLVQCTDCGAEWGFNAAGRCPECGSTVLALVEGCPTWKRGNETVIFADVLRRWMLKRAKPQTRTTWAEYRRQLEEAIRAEQTSPGGHSRGANEGGKTPKAK